MAGRKQQGLEVSRPTGRARVVELCKDVLIVALICSAAYLCVQSQTYGGILGLNRGVVAATDGKPVEQSVSWAQPVGIAVCSGMGEGGVIRYGAQYNSQEVEALFEALGGFLQEAAGSAGTVRQISERDWQQALQAPGIYFELPGTVPLELLSGEESPKGSVRRLAVAFLGDPTAALCYINEEDGSYYACNTQLVYEGRLKEALASYGDNKTFFAFEQEAYHTVEPYVLIELEQVWEPEIYLASNPANPADPEQLAHLKQTLGFPNEYVSGQETVLWEGSERVRVGAQGTVRYQATQGGEENRYVLSAPGELPTRSEVLETLGRLVARTVASRCGQARVYLEKIEETGPGSWEVCFGYHLNGARVLLAGQTCAAHFTITDGTLVRYTLYFRSYEPTGQTGTLMRQEQAVAAMEAMGEAGSALAMCYADGGGETVQARWTAR